MTENVEQIQACRDALAPEDVLIGDANGGSNMIMFFNIVKSQAETCVSI